MILRNRFNLAFVAIFGTALAAILLVFVKANAYVRQIDDSNKKNQWAVVVERLRFSIIQKQLELESFTLDSTPFNIPIPVPHWVHLVCNTLAAGDVREPLASWLHLPTQARSTRELLDSVSATLNRLPETGDLGDITSHGEQTMRRVRAAIEKAKISLFTNRQEIEELYSALHAVAVMLQSHSVNAQREATEIGFAVVSLAAYSCVFLVVEFGIFWILVRSWTIHPIMSLAGDAQRLHQASPDFRLKVERSDEIGQLAESLNDMMARLRERERQLARARELAIIGEICSGVAHGMRNPLAVIRLSAQRFAQAAQLSPQQESILDDIVQQVDRLNDRITRLLRFASSLNPRHEPVEFGWLSSVAVRESMAALSEHDLKIEILDETGGVSCVMDPDLTVQAVVECISNSAHHSPRGGSIILSGRVTPSANGHGREWRVSIHDQGKGIQPEIMNNIFDLFFTLRENGTGVGLSMVKRIVEQHSGHIEVESPPGQGTTFHLCWPLKSDGN